MSSINLQENQSSSCETYIAIVVDESGSIDTNEAVQIRSGLSSFINSQADSNITLSLIGMSYSDNQLRSDNIIQKRISGNQQEFLNWITAFGIRNINAQSDFWASGLEVVNNLPVTPDIIIVITDGLQVNTTNTLKGLYSNLNQKSHVFVYGVTSSWYEVNTDVYTDLQSALAFYLEKTPLLKNSSNSILVADYSESADFTTLNTELNQLTTDLAAANIGCIANVEIVENNLFYPNFKVGDSVSQEAGSLVLKNKSRIPLVLEAGTIIHDYEASLGGMVFTTKNTVTIPALSSLPVVIQVNGTIYYGGDYSQLIYISNVNNPNQFRISYEVEKVLSGCETHVAIVVDESASISQLEAQQIQNAISTFVYSQQDTNTILSLIGMSHSDNDLREDHIIQKKVANNSDAFYDWIDGFGSRSINAQSDYWASGLNRVKNLSLVPDIVIIIADGMQVNDTSVLQNLYTTLNQKSHIFVYGVTGNDAYSTVQNELVTPLSFYLGRNPILRSEDNNFLDADFVKYLDFSDLNTELNQLSIYLDQAHIGCSANVEIIESNLAYTTYVPGVRVNKDAGTMLLKNKSRLDLTLYAGTRIHKFSTINGLIFTIKDTLTIPAYSELEVDVRVTGKPKLLGYYEEPITLNNVNNPLQFKISFNVIKEKYTIDITSGKTALQSSNLQIIAAGSQGNDSTKGIHLRWMLAGELGEKHLPKGNLYTGSVSNFNKPDDFVKVYKAPYYQSTTRLDLTEIPNSVDRLNARWIYTIDTGSDQKKVFYVYFKNKAKYLLTSLSHNPKEDPAAFIEAYGNNLIEIENKKELFFAARLYFNSVYENSLCRLETLSVAENTTSSVKKVTTRKTFTLGDEDRNISVVAENGRSIRFKASNCLLGFIYFEFYSDFIKQANDYETWELKGKFALSLDDSKVFAQLEPKLNAVHGKWLKYNDGEYVNIANYKDKWQHETEPGDKNIKEVLSSYIQLSLDPGNPTAVETVKLGESAINEPLEGQEQQYVDNTTELSNLDLLNIAANDYHIARMLGLGFIDIDDTDYSNQFVYLTEYTTFGDLNDGLGAREVQHISMSIPTSAYDERLPLPVQISKIAPGLNVDEEGNEPAKITDKDGYSFDGKKRYVSLFMEDIMDYSSGNTFFDSSIEYDGSKFTFPIYVGVDYKVGNEPAWRKPELASDSNYKNVNKDLVLSNNEPNPIVIPESHKAFLNVRQEDIGLNKEFKYQGYGINIFSRAVSGAQKSIISNIQPKNTLMPPANINSLLVTKESPLMFTSANEQVRYDNIAGPDKTFIRVLFDYYTVQELLNYTVPETLNIEGSDNPDSVYNKNTIYKDDEELFADYFNLYFRDSLPEIASAKIKSIETTNDRVVSTVTIEGYTIYSTGEEIPLNITLANKDRFVGGVLTIGDQNFIVTAVNIIGGVVMVDVMNKEVATSIVSEGTATIDSEQIKPIIIPDNRLCALVENMLTPSNWNAPRPLTIKVDVPDNFKTINRELIQPKDNQGKAELQVEKTRGIWENVRIERIRETAYKRKESGEYEIDPITEDVIELGKRHLGLYKVIFKDFQLPQHSQYDPDSTEKSVEWFNGIVRLFTKSSVEAGSSIPVKPRKEFKVVRTKNIGKTKDLVVYINDTDFKLGDFVTQMMDSNYDEIIGAIDQTEYEELNENKDEVVIEYDDYVSQKANFYPSYKVNLFANPANGITADKVLPREDEDIHYSIIGISTHGKSNVVNYDYSSSISAPSPMYAVKIVEPLRPEQPKGGLYATRPDYFKRSTYTFTTKYKQKPYGALHYRANDEGLLSVLYERNTINVIREKLNELGGNNEAFFGNRWENFLNFDALIALNNDLNPSDLLPWDQIPAPAPIRIPVEYKEYPEGDQTLKFRFPVPDNLQLIASINEFIKWHNETQNKNVPNILGLTALNDIVISNKDGIQDNLLAIHFIEQAIHTAFVPLTEVPVIYDFIKDNTYVPINKKQTIKDKNGALLKPEECDIAPMMKIADPVNHITQFTDFNLDGTSQNIYFYGVREMDIKMNFSEFGLFLGPVKLVQANPPQTPEIKRIMPVLENPVLGIKPAIQIELNPYRPEHNIKKINIYRATSMLDAQSIRTMTPVKEVLVSDNTLSAEFDNIWSVYDEFEDLEFVPFGDGLFYRITVSREIEYADPAYDDDSVINIDYSPSQPSKITATVIVDSVSPESPDLQASGELTGTTESILKPVIFNWEKTVHNGTYLLYKMNRQGNWDKIHEIVSNEYAISLPLDDVNTYSDELIIKTEDGERIYHHFKMISVNSSGMFSSEEKILTL